MLTSTSQQRSHVLNWILFITTPKLETVSQWCTNHAQISKTNTDLINSTFWIWIFGIFPPPHFFYHYALNEHRKNKYDSQWKCTNEAFKAFFAPITDAQCGTCAVALVIWVSKGDFSEESGSELSESSWCCIILQTFFKLKICQRLWSALRHTHSDLLEDKK